VRDKPTVQAAKSPFHTGCSTPGEGNVLFGVPLALALALVVFQTIYPARAVVVPCDMRRGCSLYRVCIVIVQSVKPDDCVANSQYSPCVLSAVRRPPRCALCALRVPAADTATATANKQTQASVYMCHVTEGGVEQLPRQALQQVEQH
jgi:hypothetical protein